MSPIEKINKKPDHHPYNEPNFGSFFSTLLIPLVLQYYGPAWAFGIPGILMLLATLIFFLGRKKYVRVPPSGFKKENFIAINFFMLKNMFSKPKGQSLYVIAASKYSRQSIDGIKAVWKVLAVFAFVPFFWMLNDQNSSEWVLQASKMIHPQRYLFCCYLAIQLVIDRGGTPGIGWQFLAYIIISAAEVMVYQTGLEYAYTQAPASMKSTIMSFWLLTIALGNIMVSAVNSNITSGGIFSILSGAQYYLFFTVLMAVVSVVYIGVSRKFKENNLIQP